MDSQNQRGTVSGTKYCWLKDSGLSEFVESQIYKTTELVTDGAREITPQVREKIEQVQGERKAAGLTGEARVHCALLLTFYAFKTCQSKMLGKRRSEDDKCTAPHLPEWKLWQAGIRSHSHFAELGLCNSPRSFTAVFYLHTYVLTSQEAVLLGLCKY